MRRHRRFAILGVVLAAILVLSSVASAAPARIRPGYPDGVVPKREINQKSASAFMQGGPDALNSYMHSVGFDLVSSAQDVVLPDSSGTRVKNIDIKLYREESSPYRYVVTSFWKWSGTFDWNTGPEDVVAINFETKNGEPVTDTLMGDEHYQTLYWKTGRECGEGSVWKIDNQAKGVIFKFAERATLFNTDQCGAQVWTNVWVDEFPAEPRPIVAKVHYEHNWKEGALKDASLEIDSSGKVSFKVVYESTTQSWQREAQAKLYPN